MTKNSKSQITMSKVSVFRCQVPASVLLLPETSNLEIWSLESDILQYSITTPDGPKTKDNSPKNILGKKV